MSESETPQNPGTETSEGAGEKAGSVINRPSTPGDRIRVNSLGLFLFFIPFIIIFLIYILWPTVSERVGDASQKGGSSQTQQIQNAADPTGTSQTGNPADSSSPGETGQKKALKEKGEWSKTIKILGWEISFQLRMIILVFLCGALGSYIHMATSFSHFLGAREFGMDWLWWYWLRMPIGGVLALIFSLLIQGGVFANTASSPGTQPVTLMGLAALVGMFSRQATEKLREVFDVVFKTKEGESDKTARGGNGNEGQGNAQGDK